MDVDIKKMNIDYWTKNVPHIDALIRKEMVKTKEFYKKTDEVRYRNEPYLMDFFLEILRPGLVSLEVGCGLGNDFRYFSRAGLKSVGLDYSPENVFISNLGLETCGLEGRAVCGDAEALPFPSNSFDLVYSWGCLHHSPDTQKSINELYRVLRPGGEAMVMLYHKGYQFWCILMRYMLSFKWLKMGLRKYISLMYDHTPLSQMFSKEQLNKLFSRYGNVNIQIVTFGAIQFHPILKYVWRIFQMFPWLLKKYGSFAVVFANKPGSSYPVKEVPEICCPMCYSQFKQANGSIKCTNPKCNAQYFFYKEKIPVLHSNATKEYCERMEKESIS